MRRKFFGGRPIIARTDDLAIRELRRLGGLLKHNFLLAHEANQPKVWHEMKETLKKFKRPLISWVGKMILKKFKRTNLARTKRAMIGGLFDYVLAEKDEAGKDKCVWSTALNFIAATRKGQKAEMISLAEESIKSRMPVAHWMLSWNENEIPTEAQVTEAVQMFL